MADVIRGPGQTGFTDPAESNEIPSREGKAAVRVSHQAMIASVSPSPPCSALIALMAAAAAGASWPPAPWSAAPARNMTRALAASSSTGSRYRAAPARRGAKRGKLCEVPPRLGTAPEAISNTGTNVDSSGNITHPPSPPPASPQRPGGPAPAQHQRRAA